MQYDLTNEFQRKSFVERANNLIEKGRVVELTEKTFRTTSQNSYLHLLIGVVAMETGNNLGYTKEVYFKRLCNHDLFVVEKTDAYAGTIEMIRSTADLTKEEISMAIDRFKRWGYEQGFYMPNPEDKSLLEQIAVEMGRNRAYLND